MGVAQVGAHGGNGCRAGGIRLEVADAGAKWKRWGCGWLWE